LALPRAGPADYGLCITAISGGSYLAGVAIDLRVPARTFAIIVGCIMVMPGSGWAMALSPTRRSGPR